MQTADELEAKVITVSAGAKAILRRLGWSDEQIEAALRKAKR